MRQLTPLHIYIPLMIAGLWMTGCKSSAIPLSEAEMELEQNLRQEYGAYVSLSHDREAVRQGGKEGDFLIGIENSRDNICSRDSSVMIKRAKEVTLSVLGVMEHRDCYQTFTIRFESSIDDANHSTVTCMKEVTVYLQKDSIYFSELFTTPPKTYSETPY